jgi:hypothetical protein
MPLRPKQLCTNRTRSAVKIHIRYLIFSVHSDLGFVLSAPDSTKTSKTQALSLNSLLLWQGIGEELEGIGGTAKTH